MAHRLDKDTSGVIVAAKRKDVAEFVHMSMDGRIDLEDLVSHRLKLEDINEGFDLMRQGKSVRAVIVFD